MTANAPHQTLDGPFIHRLADQVAAAHPAPPSHPPKPRRTRLEAHQQVIGQLNALAYAAQNERVRLSALYALGRIHGYEYIGDRLLDLAATAATETVQLTALTVAARGLGMLTPLRSRLDPETPLEAPLEIIRLFPGDEDKLAELNRTHEPDHPPDDDFHAARLADSPDNQPNDAPPAADQHPYPEYLPPEFDPAAAPEPMPGFGSNLAPQAAAPPTQTPARPRNPAKRGPTPIRLAPRNPLPRLPAYPRLPQQPAAPPDPAHSETFGETAAPNHDQPPPQTDAPPPDETPQARENTRPPQPTPPTDLPRPPP